MVSKQEQRAIRVRTHDLEHRLNFLMDEHNSLMEKEVKDVAELQKEGARRHLSPLYQIIAECSCDLGRLKMNVKLRDSKKYNCLALKFQKTNVQAQKFKEEIILKISNNHASLACMASPSAAPKPRYGKHACLDVLYAPWVGRSRRVELERSRVSQAKKKKQEVYNQY
eukprot:jgi/Bigna1/76962/fgenesh1_pg.45_\